MLWQPTRGILQPNQNWRRPQDPGGGAASTTLNNSDRAAAVVLSGGDLVMTNVGNVRSVASHTTGKYCVEMTPGVTVNGFDHAFGLAKSTASLTNFPGNPDANSFSWANGSSSIDIAGGSGPSVGVTYEQYLGDIAYMAVDLGASLLWCRVNGGNWNGNAANDPSAGTGGVSISSITGGALFVMGTGQSTTTVNTFKFDTTTFSFAAPSGFGSF